MTNDEPTDHDKTTSTDERLTGTTTATSSYKVLGEFGDATGAGVLGRNTSTTGTPIGVKGAVPNNYAGYGLVTPDDARVGGTAELSSLGGSLTGGTTVDTLAGDDLTIAEGALTLGPTSVATDTASTFIESDVTVTYSTATGNSSGDIVLRNSGPSRDPDDSTLSTDNRLGIDIEVNTDLVGVTATVSRNTSGESTVYLMDGNTELASEPSPGAGNSVTLNASMTSGVTYTVAADAGGSTYTAGYDDTPNYPYNGGTLDIVTNGTVAQNIYRVEGAAKSGTATVEFSRPSSVRRWESVAFDTANNGGGAELYAETSSDGGSTWSDWQSKPIAPGTDLSAIPPSDRVRFRTALSRDDPAEDPRLTLLSRQYSP